MAAFQRESGYNNLANGVFSPTVFSKKAQIKFRKGSVVQDITNTDYFGEIASMGDSVRVIKEPDIVVNALKRGTPIVQQDLVDEDFTLTVDQANYFSFGVDDIEKQQAHNNWIELASDKAGYAMEQKFDEEVLGYMTGYTKTAGVWAPNTTVSGTKANAAAGSDELLSGNKLTRGSFGQTTNPGYSISVGTTGVYDTTPLALLNRLSRLMDEADVPQEDRYFVADPVFYELLQDENSKLINNDFAKEGVDILRNGRVVSGLIRGFKVYKSRNLPKLGTGPGTNASAGSATNFGLVLAGHMSAVTTAEQLNDVENFRSQTKFADIIRGKHLYGRKILRPDALFNAKYNIN